MNTMEVHNPNKVPGVNNSRRLLIAGVLVSTLLTACGGGSSGPSAEELAAAAQAEAEAAEAAAQAAAQAEAEAAAQAAAEAAAAEQAEAARQASIAEARSSVDTVIADVDAAARSADTARSLAGWEAAQAEQQGRAYGDVSEVAASVAEAKRYAEQAADAAGVAASQKQRVRQAVENVQNLQTLVEIQQAANEARQAVFTAQQAKATAEQALKLARMAHQEVVKNIAVAQASRRYTKLDAQGNELPSTASSWACLEDKQTGLVWEMKTDDNGLRDKDWRYRHLHNSAGYAGTVDYNGKLMCLGLGTCDAYSYVNAVKSQGLCGRSSWRLPKKGELGTIAQINEGGVPPHIDQTLFPDTVYKPYEAAYCTENMIKDPVECGYAPGSAVHYNADGRIECNYQGVDFGLPLLNGEQTQANLENSILVPLRYYGEVKDGKPLWPNANWLCYTRLVSSY